MRTPNVIAAMAGFGAGLVAALVAVALSAAGGAFEFGTTVTERVAAPAALVPVPAGSAGAVPGFDAGAVYRARIAGVVTISSVLPAGGEIGGSGFVVSGDGLILTNAHVVTNSGDTGVQPSGVHQAQHVYVQFSNEDKVEARVVGYDLFDDVALVRVDPGGLTLHPVPLGNSSHVRVGQPVAAIGSPFSQAGSLSVGVVSAINRSIPSLVTRYAIPGAIQTDAAINHGNSGGPLFDARGRVIGINAQINTTSGGGEGVGFAVPIDAARRSMQQLLANGRVSYGWLGVRLSTVTEAIAHAFGLPVNHGVLIETVTGGGPADRAGLRGGSRVVPFQDGALRPDGDLIVRVDGVSVATVDQMLKVIGDYNAGRRVAIDYYRGGQLQHATVTLGERPLTAS